MADSYFLFDDRFAEAFLHQRKHVVLGRRLKPFSYWHKLQLEWINSKILLGNPGPWDLWLAVRICQSQFPNQARLPGSKKSSWWQVWWNIANYGRRWDRETEKFREYLGDYCSPPKLWGGQASAKQRLAEAYDALYALTNDSADAKEAASWHRASEAKQAGARQIDDSLEAVACYCKRGGGPAGEAWNMAMGELQWMNAVFYQMDGGKLDIWTPGDQIRFERHLLKRAASIEEIAETIRPLHPDDSQELLKARAAVAYWERVVVNVDAGAR